ncbi:MAG: helix-turn-helix domain-containing protein [Actinomycetota bacterium]|nr:helix-turn-helix domain-containing protein [Actinomycetota bacterium]
MESQEAVFALLSRLARIVRVLRESNIKDLISEVSDPSPRHMIAIAHIATADGISVSDISARMSISLAAASQLVSQMANAGLIDRYEDPSDHRRTLLKLSEDRGVEIKAQIAQRTAPIASAIETLSEQRFEVLLSTLDQIVGAIEHPTSVASDQKTEVGDS